MADVVQQIDARISRRVREATNESVQFANDQTSAQNNPVRGYVDSSYIGGISVPVNLEDGSVGTASIGAVPVVAGQPVVVIGGRVFA